MYLKSEGWSLHKLQEGGGWGRVPAQTVGGRAKLYPPHHKHGPDPNLAYMCLLE